MLNVGDRIPEAPPQAGNQQVPDGMIIQRAVRAEPVLQHIGPGPPGLVITAKRRQRHPQVSWRQAVELLAQPTGGTPVIGDSDDGG